MMAPIVKKMVPLMDLVVIVKKPKFQHCSSSNGLVINISKSKMVAIGKLAKPNQLSLASKLVLIIDFG